MNKKGFTLIELLVVVSIIGMLSSIVFTALNSARDMALGVSIDNISSTYIKAIESYAAETGGYPLFFPSPMPFPPTFCLGDYTDNRCGTINNLQENATLDNILAPYLPQDGLPLVKTFFLNPSVPLEYPTYSFGTFTYTCLGSDCHGSFNPTVFWVKPKNSSPTCPLGATHGTIGFGAFHTCTYTVPTQYF